ncbi:hypothetical protein ACQ4WX_27220 [Streptomyces lasalocidi]
MLTAVITSSTSVITRLRASRIRFHSVLSSPVTRSRPRKKSPFARPLYFRLYPSGAHCRAASKALR